MRGRSDRVIARDRKARSEGKTMLRCGKRLLILCPTGKDSIAELEKSASFTLILSD
jgi:hypothetical protein